MLSFALGAAARRSNSSGLRAGTLALREVNKRIQSERRKSDSLAMGTASERLSEEVPERIAELNKPSVWLEFSPLAKALDAINLGQGFPDWAPPDFVTQAAVTAFQDPTKSRYSTSRGHPRLLQALADHYAVSMERSLDPQKNFLVTVGASQGISLALQSFVDEGDEVVLVEPAFDLYLSNVSLAKGVPKFVPLRSKSGEPESSAELHLDPEELRKTLSEKSRLLILNSPHNPTGKMFTREEYQQIADVLKDFPRCMVLSDEVYEHIVFDGREHIPFATIDDMFDRTVTLSSAGKTFSVTGWKTGWAIAPEKHIRRLINVQQHLVFCVCTPVQEAVAIALETAKRDFQGHPTYYKWLASHYAAKREILLDILNNAGLHTMNPEGGFFIMNNTDGVQFSDSFPEEEHELIQRGVVDVDPATMSSRDYNYCRWLSYNCGVTAIPATAFYCTEHAHLGRQFARFAFCKTNEALYEAGKRMLNA